MPSEISFQNIILAEAIGRAAKVAPSKGAAFDKAAGILIEASPAKKRATIRSTDLEVNYQQTITAIAGTGDDVTWRIPSAILDGFIQSLDKGEAATTTFIGRGDDKIRLKSGRTITAVQLLDAKLYPLAEEIPDFSGTQADELAARVDQVAWAADPKVGILKGVYIDGERIVGCSNYSIAVMPCKVDLPEPIVAPLETMRTLLRSAPDVRIATEGHKLYIALDDQTVCSTTLIQGSYPKIDGLLRQNFLGTIEFHKGTFNDCMARINTVARQERLPKITLSLDTNGLMKMLTLDVEVEGVARIRDEMDVQTEYAGSFSLSFIPNMLERAIENTKGDLIKMDFGVAEDPSRAHSVRITDQHHYICYVMPKVK